MSACAMQTFNNITRAAWTCIQTAAAKYGIAGADSGQASVDGFTVTWSYAEATEILHIQCIDSPWYVTCTAIISHINDAITPCLEQHNIQMEHMVPA